MGKTSNEVKQRWNDAHYKQMKFSIDPEVAEQFKKKCASKGVSMASEISRFMCGENKKSNVYQTRKLRRKELDLVISKLELIRNAEQEYRDNIPENLQAGERYDSACHAVDMLDEALELLYQVF